MKFYLSAQVVIAPSLLPVCAGCQLASTPPVVPAMQASAQEQASGQDRLASIREGIEGPWQLYYPQYTDYRLCRGPTRPTLLIGSAAVYEVDLEESSNGSAAMSVDEDESGSAAVFTDIVWHMIGHIGHPWPWRAHGRRQHWGAEGHACGQSCGCCRACHAEDWPSGCEVCLDLYELSLVNKLIRRAVAWQATAHTPPYRWGCPATRSADGESSIKRLRTGSAEGE